MTELRFNDGVSIPIDGPLRIHKAPDGFYVVGEGLCLPANDREDAQEIRGRLLALREDPAYPDSRDGALRLLSDETDLDLFGAIYSRDPVVPGCWLIELQDGTKILAYLGSHPEAPDFEIAEG